MENTDSNIQYYQTLYLKYAPELMRFARKFVEEYAVEDMVQDAFLKIWDKQLLRLPENDLKRMLYIIVKNLCIDSLRHALLERDLADSREMRLSLEELERFEHPEDLLIRKDQNRSLMLIIEELPEKCREVLLLFYMENHKMSEIAEQMNLSIRTVENHLYRAIQFLRKKSHRLLWLLWLIKITWFY